jgi:hypothetical protein
MKFRMKGARLAALLVPTLALATPAFAQVRATTLSDSQEPGSVIVFPKFIQQVVSVDPPFGLTTPRSELNIGIVCPKGVTCAERQPVKIRFHWVCGTSEANLAGSFICQETDFDVTATVFEKIVLTPNGEPANFYTNGLPTKIVPAAPCPRGYLIGWVISPANDQPIKFDGLVGDADLRESGTALASYSALPIQADPALANGAAVTTNGNGALIFDGGAGHYQAVTGQVIGDVRYDVIPTATAQSETLAHLTLLTLDVKSNRPNNPVFVDLDFFGGNPSAIGNENQLSTTTEFVCWEETPIRSINGNLNSTFMGRKGVVVSDQATKVGIFGITDDSGPTTLLGLSETTEGKTTAFPERNTFYNLFNSSVPVATKFVPTPSPNFLP